MNSLGQINFHIVDDNDIDIAVNSKLLSIAKISEHISVYKCANQFLNYLRSTDFDSTTKHVVLLDIMMPEISGFDCLDRIKDFPAEITSKLFVFMLSSSIDRNDIRKAESYHLVQKILEKPLDIFILKRYIEQIFES